MNRKRDRIAISGDRPLRIALNASMKNGEVALRQRDLFVSQACVFPKEGNYRPVAHAANADGAMVRFEITSGV